MGHAVLSLGELFEAKFSVFCLNDNLLVSHERVDGIFVVSFLIGVRCHANV